MTDVSVIIPVYNGAESIRGAVSSILELNPEGVEIILVDDCSTDESLAVCTKLSEDFPSLKVLHNDQNSGVAFSRQRGVEASEGKYVTFCDQDDVVCAPYSEYIRKMEEENADLLVANYWISYKGNRTLSAEIPETAVVEGAERCKYLAKGVLFKSYTVLEPPVLANTVWNCIFRKSLIFEAGLKFRGFVSWEDDWLFLIDFLSVAGKAVLSADPFYVWNVSDNSQSKSQKRIENLPSRSLALLKKVRSCARKVVPGNMERFVYICRFTKRLVSGIIKNALV